MSPYIKHFPVMCSEIIGHVVQNPDGFYVDCTFGSGGHSREILKKLSPNGRLIALDVDEDSYKLGLLLQQEDSRFRIYKENFSNIDQILKREHYPKIDGIIFDLGASNNQLKNPEKGFSYMNTESILDMRMSKDLKISARDILSKYSRDELKRIFRKYGQIQDPSKLVANISMHRKSYGDISKTGEFVEIIKRSFGKAFENNICKIIKKCFQALRIEVNGELDSLCKVLRILIDIVNKDGFVGFITFHSLEEKLIREWKSKNCDPIRIEDYGFNPINNFLFVTDSYVMPSSEEIQANLGSSSAKMWIAKKHR